MNLPKLKISDNRRFIVTEGGAPFFWLGDTAFFLFHKLSLEDVNEYLGDRAAKEFNVVANTHVLPIFGMVANFYGHTPLIAGDPQRPNPQFFEHVDRVVARANELGLYVAMLPYWGQTYVGKQDKLFTPNNLDDARAFGAFLGDRYKENAIVWMLGGCDHADGVEEVYRTMAAGLEEGHRGTQLMSYHPPGERSSSTWFHSDEWLDFNSIQTGHRLENRAYKLVQWDYQRENPVKPTMDAEGNYETAFDEEQGHWLNPPRITAYEVRKCAYSGLFEGALGYTYGCRDIWQFYTSGEAIMETHGECHFWKEALQFDGARQMKHLRALFESRPQLTRMPDMDVIDIHWSENRKYSDHIGAIRDTASSYAFVYMTLGKKISIRMDTVADDAIAAWWYDPRDGTAHRIGEFPSAGVREFTPPTTGVGNDWVLVLDASSKNYAPPGQISNG